MNEPHQLRPDQIHRQPDAGSFEDPAFAIQIGELQAEHDRLVELERRVSGELDTHRAPRDLPDPRQTAAQAHDRLQDLLVAWDDAQARATALTEAVRETDGDPLRP